MVTYTRLPKSVHVGIDDGSFGYITQDGFRTSPTCVPLDTYIDPEELHRIADISKTAMLYGIEAAINAVQTLYKLEHQRVRSA